MTTWANNTINKATDAVPGTAVITDATSPGTASNDNSVGTEIWVNVDNIKVSDGNDAATTLSPGSVSNYLKASNFGFSIPTGVTITGIKVDVEKDDFANGGLDNAVRIIKSGTIGSTDKSNAVLWPASDAYVSYGGSTELWGETWTAEDINLATFGFAISAKTTAGSFAHIDHIRITVYYTTAGTTKEVLTHTYVIEGDGDYVDTGQKVSIGSTTIGSKVIGGGGSTEASPFEISFPINSDRFVDVRIRVEAVGIGFVQCNSFRFHDIRDKGVHNLPTRTT